MVFQNLVFPAGEVMMIAVTTQFKQHNSTDRVIAVPAMPGHGSFVAIVAGFFSG